jgi:ribosome biogenesis GTPase
MVKFRSSSRSTSTTASTLLQQGRVVATFGRHVLVEDDAGQTRICHPRGKKNEAVVGDRVAWHPSQDEGTIEQVLPRRNVFYRQDEIRTKSFAANIDQVLILLAAEPEFSERQLTRALIAAEATGIQALIVLNKLDLLERFERAWTRLEPYRGMNYAVMPLGLHEPQHQASKDTLYQHLQGRVTLVLGPSGVGKSTLINYFVPHAQALTNVISKALNSGKHTTTATRWYWMDEIARDTVLIDSPGFQEFGLHHIEAPMLAQLMPDLRVHLGHCKFANCTHLHEPGCGILQHLQNRDSLQMMNISDNRYQIYKELFLELSTRPQW